MNHAARTVVAAVGLGLLAGPAGSTKPILGAEREPNSVAAPRRADEIEQKAQEQWQVYGRLIEKTLEETGGKPISPNHHKMPEVTVAESDLLAYHNIVRSEVGLQPLELNPKLTLTAQITAEYLVTHDFLHPATPEAGLQLAETVAGWHDPEGIDGDIEWYWIGENISVSGPEAVATTMEAWVESDGHFHNIVNSHFTQVGFGYALGADGRLFMTVHFAAEKVD